MSVVNCKKVFLKNELTKSCYIKKLFRDLNIYDQIKLFI